MQNSDLGFIDIYLAGATGGIGQQIARKATGRVLDLIADPENHGGQIYHSILA